MRHRAAVAAVVATLAFAFTASTAAAAQLPVIYNGVLGYAHASPTASPPGANNWSCKPSAAHPVPVILVHGTFGDMSDSWQALSPLLYDKGYCVFALNYGSYNGSGSFGVYATGKIEDSAAAALELRRPRPGRDGRAQGRPRRPLAGRHDAALLHQEPRWRLQGADARRAGAFEPRHHSERDIHARELLPRQQLTHRCRLPRVRRSRKRGRASSRT